MRKEGTYMRSYDLIVAGGGLTGVAAAYAAAREGLKVMLIEKSGFLGGAACNCYVNPFMPYKISKEGAPLTISRGLFLEILRQLDEMEGLHNNCATFNEEYLKLILDRLMSKIGVDVLFHSYVTGVKKDGEIINSILLANVSGTVEVASKYFVDATGDAALSVLADCPYEVGRETDHLCQPMTLCFRLAGVDTESIKKTGMTTINEAYKKAQIEGKIKNPREDILLFPHLSDGVLHFNSTRVVKHCPVDCFDLSKAEVQAREQVYELYTFLRENITGFEKATLLASAPEIGVRESRMIIGDYKITADDLVNCVKFSDAIAVGAYEIDIHSPDGGGTTHVQIPSGNYYTIPYRALIPQNTSNLLTAGRCISSTHEAQASYRIMPICCCMGEGAGIAISVALKSDKDVRLADMSTVHTLMDKYDLLYK